VTSPTETTPSARIMSVDALRGFDMFWIIGGQQLVLALCKVFADPLPAWLERQFEHVSWVGFAAWDLIMPLFLFVVGVAMPFSFSKRALAGQSRRSLYLKIIRRTLILFVLGMIAQGNLLKFDLSTFHIYSNTLQAIACGYIVAAVVMLNLGIAWQVGVAAICLVAFYLLMMFVPVPGHGSGILEREVNLAMYVDELVLGRFRDGTTYTWVLSGLGFAASTLLGVFGGHILRANRSHRQKLLALTAAGIGCLVLGWLWSFWFPIIKRLWTSSMVLWAAGWSYLLLAVFYGIIDVLGFRKWAFPFVVIGMNAIAVYMATHVLSLGVLSYDLVGGLSKHVGSYADLLMSFTNFLIVWLILLYMYRKKTFIRV